MKAIGIMTEDFTVYHDLIKALRNREIPFASLTRDEEMPANIGVILVSGGDHNDGHPNVVVVPPYPRESSGRIPEIESAIDAALGYLMGGIHHIIIGVDPGKYPGVAVLADGRLINTYHLINTSSLRSITHEIRRYHQGSIEARVGNGSPEERDEAVEIFLDEGIIVHIVDERGTTKQGVNPDVRAAIQIAKHSPIIEVIRPKTA